MEDKLLFLEAFFLTGIMRFKILKKPFNKLKEEMAKQKLEEENQDDTTDDNSDTNVNG